MSLRIGSLCSGYRGLDMAVESVFGGTTAWVSDIDPGANKILAHHWPQTPNIGDLTTTDWGQVEPVDVVCGGYPCQPFSLAGELKGTDDERHLWPHIARALRVLRPRYAIFENVANHLRLGFDTVLADLADLGFDVEWCVVRADEVGAPHQRRRLIFLATAANTPNVRYERSRSTRGRGPGPEDGRIPVADAEGFGRGEGRSQPAGQQGRSGAALGGRATVADSDRGGLARNTERDLGPNQPGQQAPRRNDARRPGVQRGTTADTGGEGLEIGRAESDRHQCPATERGGSERDWGRFAPAVRRWEAVTGRRAPWATDDRNRLSPVFVEWLMGLPAGHVTSVPELTRTQQLKALGNGVVPQQADAALRMLHARAREGRTAA